MKKPKIVNKKQLLDKIEQYSKHKYFIVEYYDKREDHYQDKVYEPEDIPKLLEELEKYSFKLKKDYTLIINIESCDITVVD